MLKNRNKKNKNKNNNKKTNKEKKTFKRIYIHFCVILFVTFSVRSASGVFLSVSLYFSYWGGGEAGPLAAALECCCNCSSFSYALLQYFACLSTCCASSFFTFSLSLSIFLFSPISLNIFSNFSLCSLSSSSEQREQFTNESSFFLSIFCYIAHHCTGSQSNSALNSSGNGDGEAAVAAGGGGDDAGASGSAGSAGSGNGGGSGDNGAAPEAEQAAASG